MSRNGLWSALQTHLQGVDGTTLAIKPKIILHCVILLSQKLAGFHNIARENRQENCRHASRLDKHLPLTLTLSP
ncbi:hypothetical protein ELI13_05275 [Rhizobium ruizarguesonis]|nr:hypothetical protein ELI24_05180 [Rhizobium ruizarguesonis]TAW88176.1 hypothetical protein ELI13_05275 [Rhizobium ruizarguesonis]TBD36863.1 hypothetical protein ELH18_05025 [Rhizobium ruizarguesonis]TBD57972.1 hypothetical protein ELH15_05035 [Rhizobium ruizarguesonis]TBD84237.1 hypothetical protein ELH13_05030 [Rhizobium ruizarguesonis]